MGLQLAGFFRELPHGRADGPSLQERRHDGAQPDEEKIAHYLESAAALSISGSMSDDYFDPSKKAVARLETATDGVWLWPRDLAYYVRNYHVDLAPDFAAHMRQRGWQPPAFTQDELIRIYKDFQASLQN